MARIAPQQHEGFVFAQRGLWARRAAWLCGISLLLYLFTAPPQGHDGSTWLGYTLGTIGAVIIIFLTWFGIRKRAYPPGTWRLQHWLSAHIWLGFSLIVIATLHTGFELGWNVHTLAYALMLLVILSGAFGMLFYLRIPRQMTENRQQKTSAQMLAEIAELDRQAATLALNMPDAVAAALALSQNKTQIGGSLTALLTVQPPNCATAEALKRLRALAENAPADQQALLTSLMVLLQRKSEMLLRLRKDLRFQALLSMWLFVHIPLTVALLTALAAHIWAVFYYW